jgi:formylglycine-generating enzyme required for sulfatase activity
MLKNILKFFQIFIISFIAVILVSLGIKAFDSFNKNNTSSPCPPGMVYVSSPVKDFCIDKYEVSPSNECPYQQPANQIESAANLSAPDCKPVSQAHVLPWVNITQVQAMQACAKAGKRLPTAEEWFFAALGTPDKNEGWSQDDCQLDNNWGAQPGLTGSGVNCRSAAGAYDMIGNVWEWVIDDVKDGVYQGRSLPDQGYIQETTTNGIAVSTNFDRPNLVFNNDFLWIKKHGLRGMARGGYWQNQEEGGIFSTYLTSPPSFVGIGVGFRCVKEINP